jgi:hypothetical protein
MSSLKNSLVAIERPSDLGHRTGRHGPIWNRSTSRSAPAIELRMAQGDDTDVVRRLADLDSAPELVGQVLIAIIDGEAAAGLSLLDQRVVANPFMFTLEAVVLLRLRAAQLRGARKRRGLPPTRRSLLGLTDRIRHPRKQAPVRS